MRLTERVLEESHKNKRLADAEAQNQLDKDEDDMGMAYDSRPAGVSLNRERGVFVNKGADGINTAPDIFERTAVFHTSSK